MSHVTLVGLVVSLATSEPVRYGQVGLQPAPFHLQIIYFTFSLFFFPSELGFGSCVYWGRAGR